VTLPHDQAALYTGRVHHMRLRPFVHKLRYHVFSVWLDIDRITDSAQQTWLFQYNRFGLLSFFDKDHGDQSGAPLRAWTENALRSVGITPPGGPIRLLCFPRILGFVFNPISLFFCYDSRQNLKAIVYEVHNTVGGAHAYVAPVTGMDSNGVIHQHAEKVFYVSPFIGMTASYAFAVRPPAEHFMLSIHETVPEGPQLTASHQGDRRAFTSAQIAWLLMANPLMTLKVFGGILWEAMFIWAKGGRYQPPVPTNGPPITRGWARDGGTASTLETIAS
jgi:uncharacterized protein